MLGHECLRLIKSVNLETHTILVIENVKRLRLSILVLRAKVKFDGLRYFDSWKQCKQWEKFVKQFASVNFNGIEIEELDTDFFHDKKGVRRKVFNKVCEFNKMYCVYEYKP